MSVRTCNSRLESGPINPARDPIGPHRANHTPIGAVFEVSRFIIRRTILQTCNNVSRRPPFVLAFLQRMDLAVAIQGNPVILITE
jgi:hypothetical protein